MFSLILLERPESLVPLVDILRSRHVGFTVIDIQLSFFVSMAGERRLEESGNATIWPSLLDRSGRAGRKPAIQFLNYLIVKSSRT